MRRKRTILNIISSLTSKILVIAFGLILPRLFITSFGSEVNGLLSSITNAFTYINLLEAGLGLSAVQALYAPIAQNDKKKVNAILAAVAISYRRVGVYVLACVVTVALIYPIVVESTISYWTIVAVFLLQGVVTAADYLIQAKNRVYLQAEAKLYVITNIDTIISIITSLFKILLIYLHFDIIKIQASFALISILKIFLFQFYMRKNYSHLFFEEEPDFKAISNRKYSFVHNAVYVISCNIDILILTVLADLKVVSVYVIYKLIYEGVKMLPSALQNGVNASFGQLYADNKERFEKLYGCFEVVYTIIVFSLFVIAYILTKPFITLYTAGVTDIEYSVYGLALAFMISEILNEMRSLSTKIIQYAGHFKQTMLPAIIELVINVILSLIGFKIMGIVGVVIATIVSSLYRLIVYTQYANNNLLNRSTKIVFMRWALNSFIAGLIIFLSSLISVEINNYFAFLFYGILGIVIATSLFSIANFIVAKAETKYLFSYIGPFIKNGLRKQ